MSKARTTLLPCHCCGYATVPPGSDYNICPICFWEDDELGDSEPELERGGPNHVSLMTARLNFLTFGAAEREALPHVRPPQEDDVRVRIFTIEDGRVVERSR